MGSQRTVDTVVIGAGFAGLSAALALREAGTDVLLLEAQAAPGGRVQTLVHEDGVAYERGGQFYCRTMTALAGLVDDYGLTRREVRKDEGVVGIVGGERRVLDREFLDFGFSEQITQADPDRPGSIDDWVRSLGLAAEEVAMIRSGCEEVMGRPIDELSFRSALACLNTFDGFDNTMEYSCEEGLGTLAHLMAQDLGDAFVANSPVSSVDRVEGHFVLATPTQELRASRVVYAASPVQLRRITWRAAEDEWLTRHHDRFVAGHIRKFVLRYDTAFWRGGDFGWLGQTDSPAGLSVMDCSDPTDRLCLLAIFCGGSAALALEGQSDDEALATVLDIVEPMLGPGVRSPVTVVQTNWTNHEWVGGGYATWAKPWADDDPWLPLRTSHHGLYFAGTELGSHYAGFIEGAVRAGREVAARVLADR